MIIIDWLSLSVSIFRQLQQQQQQAELEGGGTRDGLYETGPITLSQVRRGGGGSRELPLWLKPSLLVSGSEDRPGCFIRVAGCWLFAHQENRTGCQESSKNNQIDNSAVNHVMCRASLYKECQTAAGYVPLELQLQLMESLFQLSTSQSLNYVLHQFNICASVEWHIQRAHCVFSCDSVAFVDMFPGYLLHNMFPPSIVAASLIWYERD